MIYAGYGRLEKKMRDEEDKRRRWRDRGESRQRRTEKEDDRRRRGGCWNGSREKDRKRRNGRLVNIRPVMVSDWMGSFIRDSLDSISLGVNSVCV